jgi:hypothetical protein
MQLIRMMNYCNPGVPMGKPTQKINTLISWNDTFEATNFPSMHDASTKIFLG